jgi:predicted GTPase
MRYRPKLRRHWPEALLFLTAALPWLTLLVLGMVWLWREDHVWVWALSSAALGLLTWPLARLVRRRANVEARVALGELAAPSRVWNEREQEAWADVLTIADATAPFTFTEIDSLFASARQTIEVIARRLHPEAKTGWAQFSLPEVLLLTERLCRDVRREALHHIPGIRMLRLSHLLWVRRQNEHYGKVAQTGWRVVFGVWRFVRAGLNPLQAAGQETTSFFLEKTATVLLYRWRAYATRMLVLEVGRAAIDLYGGRLALSEEELRLGREGDAPPPAQPDLPVRLILVGQVNAGKSSLVNAMAQETQCAVGPAPTTSEVVEYRLDLDGRPTVSLVDMPGLNESTERTFLAQAERADLVLWVASAVQPARGPDEQGLDAFRAWTRKQLARRTPPIILALTHIDKLRPANEWTPPYDIAAPAGPKARNIAAAINSVASVLNLLEDAIVPVALPPRSEPYNIDALWTRIAAELDGAKLVQIDRLRGRRQQLNLRELADQFVRAGRWLGAAAVRSTPDRKL